MFYIFLGLPIGRLADRHSRKLIVTVGVFVALYGDEYTYAEMKDVVDMLRRELVLVEDVAKVETFGERTECIYVELDRDRMSQLGISELVIVEELRERNVVVDAGRVEVPNDDGVDLFVQSLDAIDVELRQLE